MTTQVNGESPRHRAFVAEPRWARRLDDRVDALLKGRFGVGLTSGPKRSLGRQVLIAFLASASVALVVLVALVPRGKADQAGMVLGPIVGVTFGAFLGALIRHRRQRG